MSTRALFLGMLAILAAGTTAWLLLGPDLPGFEGPAIVPPQADDRSVSRPAPDTPESLNERPFETRPLEAPGFASSQVPDSMIVDEHSARPAQPPAAMHRLEPGEPAPPFRLQAIDGEPFALADHRGRIVVLNFWATWCEPCHDEMPDLQEAHEELSADGVVFAGVSMDEEGASAVRAFHEAYPVDFPLLVDGLDVARRYGAHWVVPTTYIVDTSGLVADRLTGAVEADELIARVKQFIR